MDKTGVSAQDPPRGTGLGCCPILTTVRQFLFRYKQLQGPSRDINTDGVTFYDQGQISAAGRFG